MKKATFIGSAPILLVRDVVASANYYRDQVGFSYDRFWGEPPAFCILERDGFHLMLSRVEGAQHIVPHYKVVEKMWNVYFWVNDAAALFEELKGRGATIDYGLCEQPHGCLEFGIQDLDGYDVAFGQNLHPRGDEDESSDEDGLRKEDKPKMIERLDHLVLTVRDVKATVRFYTSVLGMEEITFGDGRKALRFGAQKINLHQVGAELAPRAAVATPGSADLCLVTAWPLEEVLARFKEHGTRVVEGPVERTGALGAMESVYIVDPDGNLIEVSRYMGG